MTNGEGNKPLEPKVLWYIISFIIPLVGIILGIIYMQKPEPEVKKFGKNCLIAAIVAVGVCVVCWLISFLLGGISSILS